MQNDSVFTVILVALIGGCGGATDKVSDLASEETADMSSLDALSSANPDLTPTKAYGEPCTDPSQCTSGLCFGVAGGGQCTASCTLSSASSCSPYKAFCGVNTTGGPTCYGMHVDTGADGDDAIIAVGDTLTKSLTPLSDADLFQLVAPIGKYLITVTPEPGVDVAFDSFNDIGQAIGTSNGAGPGIAESATLTRQDAAQPTYFIVRNAGSSTGGYTFSVAVAP